MIFLLGCSMIEKQLGLKHYIALGVIALAVAIASIQPLELESYLLHLWAPCLCWLC
jgi:hypothetical protein